MTAQAYAFAGTLYIDRLTDAGVSTGFLRVSNATKLAISETTDIKTLTSRMRETYGQIIATVSVKKPATLKLTLDQIDKDKLALALLGSVTNLAQTAGTVSSGTPTTLTLIPGRSVRMPHANITANSAGSLIVVATTDTVPVTVPITDLSFNLRLGLVEYVGDSLIAATPVTMSYKYGDVAGFTISGSTCPSIKVGLLLDGINLVDGTNCEVWIDEATLTPSSEVDFLSDSFMSLEMTGQMRTISGKTCPYTVQLKNA
ncbi:hypothetical protein [uncultured Thiodictyon sp.]|uniref:phage tail tube protein n=1 Tax=uncultured Thiodictyon sp. TaxID=1846217 RepID=UPI0025EE4481|nr:hypothetical protein [uncultured Thiodictyon sp.]